LDLVWIWGRTKLTTFIEKADPNERPRFVNILQECEVLKKEIKVFNRKGLHHIVDHKGSLLKFKPWLGDAFSFLYDFIMRRSIFPKKFGGDMNRHYEILSKELQDVHGKRVLELAAGTGSAVNFLPNDNPYTGTDISPGLLRKGIKSFGDAGFNHAEFYVTGAEDLPFDDNMFDVVLCILSLNFFNDIKAVFKELERVAAPGAVLICSVPVPERKKTKSTIRGILYSEKEWERICRENGFVYEAIPSENGTLLYFRAITQ
jgi:SAM-dependent methyltransferase